MVLPGPDPDFDLVDRLGRAANEPSAIHGKWQLAVGFASGNRPAS
jgi:hypothetical protein